MNRVIMMGRMVADTELKTTPNGYTNCKFRIAVDRNYQKKGEEKKADFFNCSAWGPNAEFISKWFHKGNMVLIEGEMQISQYTDKNGNPATWYEIQVDKAYFTGEKVSNGNQNNGYYGGPSNNEPPAGYGGYGGNGGYGGGYNSAPPAQNAPANNAPGNNSSTPSADFSKADSDDYPF